MYLIKSYILDNFATVSYWSLNGYYQLVLHHNSIGFLIKEILPLLLFFVLNLFIAVYFEKRKHI